MKASVQYVQMSLKPTTNMLRAAECALLQTYLLQAQLQQLPAGQKVHARRHVDVEPLDGPNTIRECVNM